MVAKRECQSGGMKWDLSLESDVSYRKLEGQQVKPALRTL